MMTKDFRMGFFGRGPFGMERRKELFEKWSNMSDSERLDFINKKMEAINNWSKEMGEFKPEDRFSVEQMDKRCEEWMKKTPEEKAEFMEKRKETFMQMHCHHSHMGMYKEE